jgi:hypothetical protein
LFEVKAGLLPQFLVANMDLCGRLTGNVGAMSVDTFYERFNLTGADQIYAEEFNFDETKQRYPLQGMEQWTEILQLGLGSPIRLSMVCFKPPHPSISSGHNRNRVMIAASKAREMLYSSFPANNDRGSIGGAMSVLPTIVIFTMSQLHGSTPKRLQKNGHRQRRPRKSCFKSIFNVNGSSFSKCLAVINYYQEETHTQVLWLSATLESPPTESSNVMSWRKMGLATYLLCMLIKQHTGIGNGAMDCSCLSLQASMDSTEEAGNFYVKLGFIRIDESENGLTKMSSGFQEVVKKSPKVWVPAGTQPTMSLFQLHHGRLFLSEIPIDLTISDGGSPS